MKILVPPDQFSKGTKISVTVLSEDSQFQLSSIQSLQPDSETISTPDNPCHGVIVPAIGHHCMSNIDGPEFRIIKSSKGRDKLSFDEFIYNFHRDSKGKKQWRCQAKNCKGRLHTDSSNVLQKLGEHSHVPEIGKDEIRIRVSTRS